MAEADMRVVGLRGGCGEQQQLRLRRRGLGPAHGVSVNSVAPSVLDTPANRQAMPDANPADWVSTSVAAQTIGFLASPAAAALHGQHLTLDT